MGKKNEKRICWHCDGDVSLYLDQCPYCGVDINQTQKEGAGSNYFQNDNHFASPFQSSHTAKEGDTFAVHHTLNPQKKIEQHDRKSHLKVADEGEDPHEKVAPERRLQQETVAFLLLLPGLVLFLFALILLLFADEGELTLSWSQNLAIFYFLGSIPMILLGWRSFRS